MDITFKHNLNVTCTTLKTSNKNFDFIEYLKKFAGKVDSEKYYTSDLELNIEKYFSGQGPKKIEIKKTIMDYRLGYFGQEGLPNLKEKELLERYIVTSKKGKHLDTFYFRKVE